MASSHFKKAVQPDHPSAKACGQAASQPPCERGIPLYPLRYGITEPSYDIAKIAESNPASFGRLQVKDYPALQGGKAYGLRVLRPDSYVYLFYFQEGRMKTRHYQVTEDIRFAHLWWTEADYNDAAPGRLARPDTGRATPYLLAPETSVADTVYLMVSDTILTHATLWKIEQDTDGLRSSLTTEVKPASPVKPQLALPHTFSSLMLGSLTKELVPSGLGPSTRYYDWSEIRPCDKTADYLRILNAMKLAQLPTSQGQVWAVALQDPLGTVSELHYLASEAVKKKTQYAARNAHKLQSAKFITGYFEAADKSAQRSPDVANAVAKQRSLVQHANAAAFPQRYAKQIAAFDAEIELAVNDINAWVERTGPVRLLGKALACFDMGVRCNARDYEKAVFNTLGGLVHTDEGRKKLEALVMAPTDQSPYWQALINGNEVLLARLKSNVADIVKNMFDVLDKFMEEYAATPTTNALIGLLQSLPPSKSADVLLLRLRHVMEVRFNATIVKYETSLAELRRFAHEFQGFRALGDHALHGWEIPSIKITEIQVKARIYIYDVIKVGETQVRELNTAPVERPALPVPHPVRLEGNHFVNIVNRLRGPGGHIFTGLGGFLALKGLADAWREYKQENESFANLVNLVGSSFAVIGVTIEITSSATVILAKSDKKVLIKSAQIFAAKRGVAVFGAGAAGIASMADLMKATNALSDSNPQQAGMYLGSAIAGAVAAFAAYGGGMATAATLAGGAGPVAVLGLTPAGWVVIAFVAFSVGIAFAFGADMAQHGPVEIWLKHSAWGLNHRHYSHGEELEAVHSLYYRPRLSAEWDNAWGYSVGTLRIRCQLPGVDDIPGKRFQTKLVFKQKDNILKKVDGPIAYPAGSSPINYGKECLVTSLGHTGKECGWAIQMHEDTQVELEYLFLPDPEHSPELAILQKDAPKPLVFTTGGFFSDPISKEKIEPVGAPQ